MKEKTTISDPPAPAEISHNFHPAHKLKLVADDDVAFRCGGCKELGAGARYKCEHDGGNCDFNLHTCCALAPDVMKHPLFEGRAFVLVHEPPNPGPNACIVCNACGDEVRGFVYQCVDSDLDIHPCCTGLPPSIPIDGLVFDLCNKQMPATSDPPAPAEISHNFHPAHKLKLVADDDVAFRCGGCKELGAGARYKCEHDGGNCDFNLHTCCALAPYVMKHPLFEGRSFVLVHEPPNSGPNARIVCDACGDEVHGFVYQCVDADLDIHPCCTRLPPSIPIDGLVFDLCNKEMPRTGCAACSGKKGKKLRKFWSYSSHWEDEAVFLHVACVKAMVRRTLEANRRVHDVGGKILGVKAPALEGLLQKRPPKKKSTSGWKRFLKMAVFVIRVIVGVIVGDPTAMIVAVVGALSSD